MDAREIMAEEMGLWRASEDCPAESATHTTASGATATPCSVVLYRGNKSIEHFPDGDYMVQVGQLVVLRSTLASVAVHDTFTVAASGGSGSDVWTVRQIAFENSAVIECIVFLQTLVGLVDAGDRRDRSSDRSPIRA